MKKIIIIICLTLFSFVLEAQEGNQKSFLKSITLRKSFASKNDKADPAIITYTNPKDGKESWLLNAALGVNILSPKNAIIKLSPYIEYHRNTLIDKEQNNWQTGFALDWELRDFSSKKWTIVMVSSLKYNKDDVKDISSFQGNFYFTPVFKLNLSPKGGKFLVPNNTVNFGKLFQFIYTPYIGLENENRLQTEQDANQGDIYRFYARVTSNIDLFPTNKKLRGKIGFFIDWQYRYNISESVDSLMDQDHTFFAASVNYTLLSVDEGKKSVKIGFDYVDGDNPNKNFEDQSFYALSLKIKI